MKVYAEYAYHGTYQGRTYTKAILNVGDEEHYPKIVSLSEKDFMRTLEKFGKETLEGLEFSRILYTRYGDKLKAVGLE